MTKLFRLLDLENAEMNVAAVRIILTFKQLEVCCNDRRPKIIKIQLLTHLFCVESIKNEPRFSRSKKFLMPKHKTQSRSYQMKTFLVSLLLFAITQTAQARELSESNSKQLFFVLAAMGTTYFDSENKRTIESISDAQCFAAINNGLKVECSLFNDLYNRPIVVKKFAAVPLNLILGKVNGVVCDVTSGQCYSSAESIQCTYWWKNSNGPAGRKYVCEIN